MFVLIERNYDSVSGVYYTDAEIDEYGLSLEYNTYVKTTRSHLNYYEWLVQLKGFRKLGISEWGED